MKYGVHPPPRASFFLMSFPLSLNCGLVQAWPMRMYLKAVAFYFIILWFSLGQLLSQTNNNCCFVKIIQNRDKK